MNKTKMISTIGPNSSDYTIIKNMIASGVDVIRINMAYAKFDFARDVILNVRKINNEENVTTGIMLDTVGPELRICGLEKPVISLERGKLIRIVSTGIIGNSDIISVPYKEIIDHTKVGDFIYLNNATVKLQVAAKNDDTLLCQIHNTGKIISESTINIPNADFNIRFLSKYDEEVIKFALQMQVDYLALSNVREESDVLDVNDLLITLNDNNIQLLSKIENRHALDQIEKILKVSDGIIISRGDLALDMNIEKVPNIQKTLTKLTKEKEKIVIVSTDILASMENNDTPTRAEVSDIANAILDNVDALILGSETAIGIYPVTTVKTMNKIIDEIENDINYNNLLHEITRNENIQISKAIAYSTVDSANRVGAKAIICSTMSGSTARDISNYRPSCPVVAISPNSKVVRGLTINYGIIPHIVGKAENTDELVELSLQAVKRILKLQVGDKVVIAGSFPLESVNYTNFMKIEEIK